MERVKPGTFDEIEASARRIANPETEEQKTERVLRCIQSPQWDFLQSLNALPGNPFYGHTEAYKQPTVTEIKPKPTLPDYDQPNNEAMAA